MIRFLKNNEIDKGKWDECIINSPNGFFYASTNYLTQLTESWDGLVLNDYEAVMPLPYRKKYGFSYVYPPAFTQQLGIISPKNIPQNLIRNFLSELKKYFHYIEINLNNENFPLDIKYRKRKNYLLNLTASFEMLRKNYSRSAIRNINKAKAANIKIKDASPKDIIDIHRERFDDGIGAKKSDYSRLLNWLNKPDIKNIVFTLGAYNNSGKMIAGSIFVIFKNRITFLLNGNSREGLNMGAAHLLLDACIEKYAGSNYILDFEGSDNPDFARFYEQYGASPEFYPTIKINRLPLIIRWLKK